MFVHVHAYTLLSCMVYIVYMYMYMCRVAQLAWDIMFEGLTGCVIVHFYMYCIHMNMCRYEQPTVEGLKEDNLGNKMLQVCGCIYMYMYIYVHVQRTCTWHCIHLI